MKEEETKALLDFCIQLRNSLDNLISRLAPVKSIAELQAKIPSELKDYLTFEESQRYYIIKPRQILGAENFAKILDAVRELGGQYVSKGKNSHFRVPRGA
jgi:hypothetical protein